MVPKGHNIRLLLPEQQNKKMVCNKSFSMFKTKTSPTLHRQQKEVSTGKGMG